MHSRGIPLVRSRGIPLVRSRGIPLVRSRGVALAQYPLIYNQCCASGSQGVREPLCALCAWPVATIEFSARASLSTRLFSLFFLFPEDTTYS